MASGVILGIIDIHALETKMLTNYIYQKLEPLPGPIVMFNVMPTMS